MHILFGTFPGIIHLNSRQNLLALFVCPLSTKKLIGMNLNNFAPNLRKSGQLDVVNMKSTSVTISRKRLSIVYYVLSYHISKCGMCKICILKCLLPAYVRKKKFL